MTGAIVLALRLLMALSLYAFLGLALYTFWRDLQQEAERLTSRRAPGISLTVREGNAEPVIKHFIQTEITLGRDPICDIPILDDTASARHARLSFHHGQWWLEDLSSTNGTRLNQELLTLATVLTTGDEIHCGAARLTVAMAADMSAASPRRVASE